MHDFRNTRISNTVLRKGQLFHAIMKDIRNRYKNIYIYILRKILHFEISCKSVVKSVDLITFKILGYIYFPLRDSPKWATPSSLSRLHVHMVKHITFCRSPLDERSAPSRDLYLTSHNNHKRQTSMSSERFKPAIPSSEQPQETHTLDRAATGIRRYLYSSIINTGITSRTDILHCVLTGALVG